MLFKTSTVEICTVINLPIVHKESGSITAINGSDDVPFEIKRVYYLYDIPGGEERGGHAHRDLMQLIIAASGAFDVRLFDGFSTKVVRLDRPNIGLIVVPGIWRELFNFSSGAISLVLASNLYHEEDYIRNIDSFISEKRS